MDFALTTEQEELRQAARSLARKFDDRYWMELDEKHEWMDVEFERLDQKFARPCLVGS